MRLGLALCLLASAGLVRAPSAAAAEPAVLSINDILAFEGTQGSSVAHFAFTVSLAGQRSGPVSVQFETSDGTATSSEDYTAATGTLTFAANETFQVIEIAVQGDAVSEANQTFFVTLSNAVGATIGDGQGQATIVDDDTPRTISVADVAVAEGQGEATFTVTLSQAYAVNLTLGFATANGTATAPVDYAGVSGTLTFAPGELSKTIDVIIAGDELDEAAESFSLVLSEPAEGLPGGVTIADGQAAATINDDDAAPFIGVGDISILEGTSGTATSATFEVALSNVSGQLVSVSYATQDGSATAPADYDAATSGTLSIPPGQASGTITVAIVADGLEEASEFFSLNLSNPTNAVIADGQSTAVITDDDVTTFINVEDVTVTEGNSGTTNAQFNVTLSRALNVPVTVQFATSDNSATAPADYAATSGTVTFQAGQTSQVITVTVNGDVLDEGEAEVFLVTISTPTNAVIADAQGVATIVDDDEPESTAFFYQIDEVSKRYSCLEEAPGDCPPGAVGTVAATGPHDYRIHFEFTNPTDQLFKKVNIKGKVATGGLKKPIVTSRVTPTSCGKAKVSKGALVWSISKLAAGATCTLDLTLKDISFPAPGMHNLAGPWTATSSPKATIPSTGTLQVRVTEKSRPAE